AAVVLGQCRYSGVLCRHLICTATHRYLDQFYFFIRLYSCARHCGGRRRGGGGIHPCPAGRRGNRNRGGLCRGDGCVPTGIVFRDHHHGGVSATAVFTRPGRHAD